MNSLLIAPDFPPLTGGIATYLGNICKHLPYREIVVLTNRVQNYEHHDLYVDYKIYRIGLPLENVRFIGSILKMIWVFFWARRILAKENIDLVQCGDFSIALSGLLLKKSTGKPYIVYTYGLEVMKRFKLKYRARLRKVILKNAEKVITISNFTKGKLLELGVKETKIGMVPPGVEVDKFRGKREHQKILNAYKIHDRRVILTVGRLIERKGQDMVIKALPTVLKRFPDVVYLIVGDGPNRLALEELTTSLNLRQKVIFAGLVPDEALPLYYEACDIFIMPSRIIEKKGHVEGFGIVYLEANLCGKPVIGGWSGGVPDAMVDGVTGVLVDPLDSSEIAEAIIKLLSNPELARKMGQAGRIRAQTEFNWDKIVGKFIRVLGEIEKNTP